MLISVDLFIIAGTMMFMWEQVMRRPLDEMRVFAMNVRKELRTRGIHAYIPQRIVYARKPEA